jgi:7-cyano-7-deazaguanine synthase
MSKIVIILSGGMDSTTLAYDLHHQGHELHALSFNYGQKHSKELTFAAITCSKLGIDHKIVPFSDDLKFLVANSALTDSTQDVPEGHYADDNMKATVVPNRNMIMLALATGYAISIGANAVAYAAHAGDHTIYPDCRPEFAEGMSQVMALCHFTPVELLSPYMNITKSDICVIGRDLGVPYGDSWTCYKGEAKPCGVCGADVERAEAFADASIPDPLLD